MHSKREKDVSRFAVQLEVANNDDLVLAREGFLEPSKVRRFTISGTVDSGASELVLPSSTVKKLGLAITGTIKVAGVDRRTATRGLAEVVYVEILNRHGTFKAIVEPRRRSALIGAIVLESLDLLVDCKNGRLVPRDPKTMTSEIE
jgi:predicted aspartyl protease